MAEKPKETPVDLTHEEIKAREKAVTDDLAKRSAEPRKDAGTITDRRDESKPASPQDR